MNTSIHISRLLLMSLAVLGTLAVARPVRADTIVIEAEGPVIPEGGEHKITSPMLIQDDATASMGRYITVESGFDSKNALPGAEGISTHSFSIETAGTYKIWGRVKAANDGDDSFWIRVDGGTAIKWNEIELGSSWHWDVVRHDGSSSPSTFSLAAGEHTIEISYREDGTKLDSLVVTSDTSFNPDSPPTTVPTSGIRGISYPIMRTAGSQTTVKLMWNAVPGATSYTVRRDTGSGLSAWQTGVTDFKVVDTNEPEEGIACYDVLAIFADNSYTAPPFSTCGTWRTEYTFVGINVMSVTSPMINDVENREITTASPTTESLNAVPAHGRARIDFMSGGSTQLRLWFRPVGPNVDADSFWVRMDNGAWFKWNGFTSGCQPVGDFTNTPVTFSVGAGSHRFEIAYREIGAKLETNFFITDNLNATSGICND